MLSKAVYYPATTKPEDNLQQQFDIAMDNWLTDTQVWGHFHLYMNRFFKEADVHLPIEKGGSGSLEKWNH